MLLSSRKHGQKRQTKTLCRKRQKWVICTNVPEKMTLHLVACWWPDNEAWTWTFLGARMNLNKSNCCIYSVLCNTGRWTVCLRLATMGNVQVSRKEGWVLTTVFQIFCRNRQRDDTTKPNWTNAAVRLKSRGSLIGPSDSPDCCGKVERSLFSFGPFIGLFYFKTHFDAVLVKGR